MTHTHTHTHIHAHAHANADIHVHAHAHTHTVMHTCRMTTTPLVHALRIRVLEIFKITTCVCIYTTMSAEWIKQYNGAFIILN